MLNLKAYFSKYWSCGYQRNPVISITENSIIKFVYTFVLKPFVVVYTFVVEYTFVVVVFGLLQNPASTANNPKP